MVCSSAQNQDLHVVVSPNKRKQTASQNNVQNFNRPNSAGKKNSLLLSGVAIVVISSSVLRPRTAGFLKAIAHRRRPDVGPNGQSGREVSQSAIRPKRIWYQVYPGRGPGSGAVPKRPPMRFGPGFANHQPGRKHRTAPKSLAVCLTECKEQRCCKGTCFVLISLSCPPSAAARFVFFPLFEDVQIPKAST